MSPVWPALWRTSLLWMLFAILAATDCLHPAQRLGGFTLLAGMLAALAFGSAVTDLAWNQHHQEYVRENRRLFRKQQQSLEGYRREHFAP